MPTFRPTVEIERPRLTKPTQTTANTATITVRPDSQVLGIAGLITALAPQPESSHRARARPSHNRNQPRPSSVSESTGSRYPGRPNFGPIDQRQLELPADRIQPANSQQTDATCRDLCWPPGGRELPAPRDRLPVQGPMLRTGLRLREIRAQETAGLQPGSHRPTSNPASSAELEAALW